MNDLPVRPKVFNTKALRWVNFFNKIHVEGIIYPPDFLYSDDPLCSNKLTVKANIVAGGCLIRDNETVELGFAPYFGDMNFIAVGEANDSDSIFGSVAIFGCCCCCYRRVLVFLSELHAYDDLYLHGIKLEPVKQDELLSCWYSAK